MPDKPARAILPLLKAPITDITDNSITIAIGAQYGSPTSMRLAIDTSKYDIRLGDIQTIYTEVLIKGATN